MKLAAHWHKHQNLQKSKDYTSEGSIQMERRYCQEGNPLNHVTQQEDGYNERTRVATIPVVNAVLTRIPASTLFVPLL